MGNSISLEENENEDQGIQNTDIEMKSPIAINEPGENSNNDNDIQLTTVKKSKRTPSDAAVKKRRATTSKNSNAGAHKKTKSVRRR
jgi:hypothetical protein